MALWVIYLRLVRLLCLRFICLLRVDMLNVLWLAMLVYSRYMFSCVRAWKSGGMGYLFAFGTVHTTSMPRIYKKKKKTGRNEREKNIVWRYDRLCVYMSVIWIIKSNRLNTKFCSIDAEKYVKDTENLYRKYPAGLC